MKIDFLEMPLKILHVDDDEEDFIIMRDLLDNIPNLSFDIDWIGIYGDALEKLRHNEHDLCLLDFHLGKHDGLELMHEARAEGCQVPFVMLTGTGNRNIDLEAMRSGASFYVDKNKLDPYDLERAIRYSLENARLLRAVQELNETLEERVEERTRLLIEASEQSLLQSKLVAMFSQNFRTPLTVILTSGALLRDYFDKMDTSRRIAQTDRVQVNARRLLRILDDMLLVAQVETDNFKFQAKSLNLERFLQSIIEEFQALHGTQLNIHLENHFSQPIMADSRLLQQILANLLSNAIKYSSATSEIKIILRQEQSQCVLIVEDQGIGIPEVNLPHLFEDFWRGSNVADRLGDGLGLAIVKRAVEIYDGSIELESEVGVGTKFTVRLPLTFDANH